MPWLLTAHVRGHRKQYPGSGHVGQGPFKVFPNDEHLRTVLRSIAGNPLRAGLVERAEAWPWSSVPAWAERALMPFLRPRPVPRPLDGIGSVNTPVPTKDLLRLRRRVRRSTPFRQPAWVEPTAYLLGPDDTLRPPGRPRKATNPHDAASAPLTLFS